MAIKPSPRPRYGHWETPISLGSGSGYYHESMHYHGEESSGGGAIKLVARSGHVIINGTVNMNGNDGTHAGGGSGGSIWIHAWEIDGTGSLLTEGGSTLLASDAGGGGGGYISLWHENTLSFDGTMSVAGKNGAEDGKIFIKEIEPILEDRFTGTIWNIKWWDSTANVTIDNDLTFNSPASDYTFPVVNSKFTVSGKEITATIDYAPYSSEIIQYSAEFLLYADESNWVGLARRKTGFFGISSVDGIMSASGVPFDNTNVTLRLLKNDSTFIYQYYDSTSTPQTIYTDVRPELADKVFKIKMLLDKPLPGDTLRTEYLRLTSLDISNEYYQLDGTAADQSAVSLNVIKGPSQYYGNDFYAEGNKVRWDSTGLSNFHVPFTLIITDYFILNSDDIIRRSIWLSELPSTPEDVAVNVISGPSQYFGLDFIIVGNRLDWAGRTLESLLVAGDELRVVYNFDPWNIVKFSELIEVGDRVRTIYEWGDYTSADNISTIFDNFKIFDGVIKNAETTESVIYVDPDYGSDSSSGRQLEPLKNLFIATAWAKRGGTVVLYDGTHNPTSISRKNITLRGAEGVKPLITTANVQDTTGSDWENTALSLYGCQGLIENIKISNAVNGIIVENGNFDIIRNTITNTSNPVYFINCDPTVARNRIGNCHYALDFTSCRLPEIYSNVIFDASVAVRLLKSPDATISSNTFDNNQTHIILDQTSPAIISDNNLTYCIMGIQVSTNSSYAIYNNNFYETAIYYDRTAEIDQSNIDMNPLYYDHFNRDYHINPGSPNVDAGILTYDPYKIDYDGATRVPDGTIQVSDIGAYMLIEGSSPINDFYVQDRGNDHWNFGSINDPFRTLDKAMHEADSTIHIDGGHYDSFYLNLKAHNIELNQLYVYTSLPQHFVSYLTLNDTDIDNGFIALPTFVTPDDSCNVALNIIGGPSQIYGSDYYVEYGSLVWKDTALENFLDTGDTLRIVFEGPLQYKALNTLVLHQHYSDYDQENAIFVSSSGSDSTVMGGDGTNTGGDGSIERPYRTISKALSQSTIGNNIVAMAGEYPIFNGLDDRVLVIGIDRTSVLNKTEKRIYEEFFNPENFRLYGTTEYDSLPWNLNFNGDSTVSFGGGFLNFTYDGTNTASAISSFSMMGDWEVTSTLRNTIDPIKFLVTSPDNTVYFYYNDGDYTTGVVTGGLTYECDSTFNGTDDIITSHITEYISLNANHIRNKAIPLSFIPEPSDCSNVALNVVGGVSQNYGEDFYIENSMIKWDGMELDGELEAGEVLRIIYHDRNLSDPVKVSMSLVGKRFTIKAYEDRWITVMARDRVGDYTGPWIVNFLMDTPSSDISHACIYGKGFISKFSAVADSFVDMFLDNHYRYDIKTERKTLTLYDTNPLGIITDSTLLDATSLYYRNRIDASGGSSVWSWPPVWSWQITDGTIPPGFMFSDRQVYASIDGTPATTGDYTFTVSLTDYGNKYQNVEKVFYLKVT